MQGLQAPSTPRRTPIRVVDLGRFKVSHAEALQEAHASLAAAEANLRALASAAARPIPTTGRTLFNRAR
ncbi:MAG TPA: hypothetical protein VM286_09965 [Candidatus Thermoplasmatota archaeon]|nr:hypothetical protein [Candidatus Thermoplasmatota archaeon]